MLTRCPHCQTSFRITQEQLTPRQGKVRCGSCRQVFNALESLSDETILRVEVPVTVPVPEVATTMVEVEETLAPTPWPFPSPQTVDAEVPPAAVSAEILPDADPDAEPEVEPEAPPAIETKTKAEPESTDADLPDAWTEPLPAPAPRRWPWMVGSVLLLLVAAAQLLYLYRIELAVLAPELRPSLVAACELAGCTVPYPRRPDLVAIDSSDLVPDNERLHLTATLKNRAPFAQEWPHLELTLTDTRDQPVLRKVLAPRDFLPSEKANSPFAVRDEFAVSLWLETPGLQPVGYRLYLFYP